MGDNTAISWSQATWNVVVGCSRVSTGCDNCYAIRDGHRMAGNPNPKISGVYSGLTTERNGRLDWTGVVRLVPERLEIPLRWQRPRRIFVNSQSDLFHPSLDFATIARVFEIMRYANQHQFQVLTKRPERMRAFMEEYRQPRWVLPNVWLGTSVEDQAAAEKRIPELVVTRATVRFLSCEPLLGPVDVTPWIEQLQWVIVGGESGPRAREMDVDWALSLKRQCVAAGVAYHFKQAGKLLGKQWGCTDSHGGDMSRFPPELRIRDYPEPAVAHA